jgi:hypothetical protein
MGDLKSTHMVRYAYYVANLGKAIINGRYNYETKLPQLSSARVIFPRM